MRHSPGRILARHSADQHANLLVNPWASDPNGSGLPAPAALEALPVPLNHSLWLNDDEEAAPVSPQMRQGDLERAILGTKTRSLR